jgi:hypothetical protein
MTEKRQTSQGYIIRIFTTFGNETSEYYYFCDALSSCDEIFVQAYLDQNFTHKGKGLFDRHNPVYVLLIAAVYSGSPLNGCFQNAQTRWVPV